MRSVLLLIILVITFKCCFSSIDDINDGDNSNDLKIHHIRRLLNREKKANNHRLNGMKEEITHNEENAYDVFQKAMDEERGNRRKENRNEHKQKHHQHDNEATQTATNDIETTATVSNTDNEDTTKTDTDTVHHQKRKRIFDYKWGKKTLKKAHPLDTLGNEEQRMERERTGDNTETAQNQDIVAAHSVSKPVVIKSVPLQHIYEKSVNASTDWSKKTFLLLLSILIMNALVILYCIYGRQIVDYWNLMMRNDSALWKKREKVSDDDDICESDATNEEEYFE